MDTCTSPCTILELVLTEQTCIPYAYGNYSFQTIFDPYQHRYLVIVIGWNGHHRIHHCLLHLEYRDGIIWIHHDTTAAGITEPLIAAGINAAMIIRTSPPQSMAVPIEQDYMHKDSRC